MKKIHSTIMILWAALMLTVAGCNDTVVQKHIYTANIPVYMSLDEFRSKLKVETDIDMQLKNPGKMYIVGDRLYINERYEGVHIFDNSNPKTPEKLTFIGIPGCVDILVNGSILYADSYIDLVMIDISDLSNIREVNRIENVFEQVYPEYNQDYLLQQPDPAKGIVIGWDVEEVEEEVVQRENPGRWLGGDVFFAENSVKTDMSSSGGQNAQATQGQGGSMARFISYQNYLYTLNSNDLLVFDIGVREQPIQKNNIAVWWDAETVFIYNHNLFIGTTNGMLLFTLDNPMEPTYYSSLQHMRSCDPVVVEGNTAYVTLRGGTVCGGTINQLDIIDISNLQQPNLLTSYQMTGPYGLGIKNGTLFVCDGDAGLKVYNANDPYNLKQIQHFANINAYDVIPLNNTLLMVGGDGFYQYDFSDTENMELISVIPVGK